MAKNTKTGRKPPKDPETPVCPYKGEILTEKIRELCVRWNNKANSYSFKIDTCGKGDPNVAWLRDGWLSLKTEHVNNNPNHVYLIDELNQVLHDDIRQWPCWVNGIRPILPAHGGEGVSFEGHLHFRDNAAALCFLSEFYRLHSCHDNPPDKKKEIENPCK
jgi:hypothetical protein